MQLQRISGYNIGCTDFQFTTEDKTVMCGRSMEFPVPMESQITVYPRGVEYYSSAPNEAKGKSWVSKYGYVGINAFHIDGPDFGMNEKGLSVGVLTLLCSEYQTVNKNQESEALALMDVCSWILGNYSTVDKVAEAIKTVRVWSGDIKILGTIPGLHFALHDATGKNLVIEFIKGEAVVSENPIGVLTNDPTLDWHIQHLAQYNHLSSECAPSIEINGYTIPSTGLGSGMKGLPGGLSSEDRYIRIAKAIQWTIKPEKVIDGLILANHILNMVDIPEGMMCIKIKNSKLYETTRWRVIQDLTNTVLFISCYTDQTFREIDLKELDFSGNEDYEKQDLQAKKPTIINITGKFKK